MAMAISIDNSFLRTTEKMMPRILNGSSDSTMIAINPVYGEVECLFICDRTRPYLCPMYRIRPTIRPVTRMLRALVKDIQGTEKLVVDC